MVEPQRERETVVVNGGGGGGGGAGLIVGIVLAILVIVGIVYFVNMNSGGEGGTVSVDVPAVDVTE
ncbi:hypothetical protein [Pelagibacterium montanilacus]|uniref:hypothetical protein n=1 Tax=Pelagibacterium montanilacus TaxID=2185280 RepID=UPI000F8C9792|nr:hypothetical protein [Pelagibacterium montanilacus]